jgi:hypothetical protein
MERDRTVQVIRHTVHQRGATVVEFALGAGIFLLATFTFALFLVWSHRLVACQYSVNVGARLAVTQKLPGFEKDPIGNVKHHIIKQAKSWQIPIKPEAIKICPYDNLNCTKESVGKDYELFSIRASFGMPLNLFPVVVYAIGDK